MFQQPSNEFQIAIKALGYLRTHWWIFAIEIGLIYGYSLLKFHRTPNIYESNAMLLIDTSRRQLYQSVMMPTALSKDNARKQNMAHLMMSQDVMERFRNQFQEYFNTEGRPLHLRFLFPNGNAHPAEIFRGWISLNWDRNSDIYSIRCTAENPDAAKDICLVFMNTAQNYYPDIGQREATMKRDFLSRQIATLARQTAEREAYLAEFQRENEELMTFFMINADGKGFQTLRGQLVDLRQKMNQNRSIKQLIMRTPTSSNFERAALGTTISALNTRLSELQYKHYLTEQSKTSDQSQRLRTLEGEINLVLSQLDKFNKDEQRAHAKNPIAFDAFRGKLTELEMTYQMDGFRLQALQTEIEDVQKKEHNLTQKRLEYERLQMELSHKRKLLGNLLQKEQETEIELSAGNSEIFRLQEPSRSGHRVSPHLSKHLFGSLSICVFMIVVTTVLLIAFFPRLDSEAEVIRLNLPVLGKIPVLKGRFGGRIDDMSPFAMEYLKIMNYRILRETKEFKCPVVVISSPQTGEGKSTVTYFLNLASQSPKRKTLFVDGDLLTAHPNVFFGIKEDHTPGLKALLEDTTALDLSSLTVKTMHEGISYLPRGGRIDSISSPSFLKPIERHFKSWREEYDMIFIDTPPLFASNLTHQWASLADLIVLVARMYVTRPKEIVEALQTCKIFSKAPVGVALNYLKLSSQQRRASSYYFSRRKPTKIAA